MRWLIQQFDRLLHWLGHLLRRKRRAYSSLPLSHTHIHQSNQGDGNQTIGQIFGGTAIANVENLYLSPQEILPLKSLWENWSQETELPLSPSLVIGEREKERDRIVSWLRGSPSSLSLQADSSEEAIAFLAAIRRKYFSLGSYQYPPVRFGELVIP
jgi:hypothetical protein